MQIICPHCRSPIYFGDGAVPDQVECPACNGGFRVDRGTALTVWQPHGKMQAQGEPAEAIQTGTLEPLQPQGSKQVFGKYELLEPLGSGAFGTAYRARDTEKDRVVVVKVARGGTFTTHGAVDRLLRDVRKVTLLSHPGVVPVLDVGQQDKVPYVVTEYVQGMTLTQVMAASPLSPQEAATLVAGIAEAVHHAHRRGVIHGNLKPSNVILDESGTPHVLGFSLNRRAPGELTLTPEGQVLGTVAYLSPEQVSSSPQPVSFRSDVYALGVLLYELLTGEKPFRGSTGMVLHQIQHEDPRPPCRLNEQLPKDLETICLKAMAKEPRHRYGKARYMAEDLERFLKGEPVKARPPSSWAKARRWVRRRPARAALVAFLALAIPALVGTAVGLFFYVQLEEARDAEERSRILADRTQQAQDEKQNELQQARDKAEAADRVEAGLRKEADEARRRGKAAEDLAERHAYSHRVALAAAALRDNNVVRAGRLLDGCKPEPRAWEWYYLRGRCHPELLSAAGSACVAFNPGGKYLATGTADHKVKVFDARTGQEIASLGGHAAAVRCVSFSPDGKLLASGGADQAVRVWETATGKEVLTLKSFAGPVTAVTFSPNSQRVAAASEDQSVRVWETLLGQETVVLRGHKGAVRGVAFSPDSLRLATAGADGAVKVWDARTGQGLATLTGHAAAVNGVAFSPDGLRVASAGADQVVKLWDAVTGKETATLRGHDGAVTAVSFHPDAQRLASAGVDGTMKVWDARTGQLAFSLRGNGGPVLGVTFNHDGQLLAGVNEEHSLRLWDARGGPETLTLVGHARVRCLAFGADSKRLAAAGDDGLVRVWELATGIELFNIRAHTAAVHAVEFSRDDQSLATAGEDHNVKVWDIRRALEKHVFEGHTEPVLCLAYSPDGHYLASGSKDRTVRVWDSVDGKEVHTLKGHTGTVLAVAFSPDNQWVASAGEDRTVRVWDRFSGKEVRTLLGHLGTVEGIAFSPDGKQLASASQDQTAQLWDAETGEPLLTLRGHAGPVHSVAYFPDGQRVATAGEDRTVKIWDARTGEEALTLPESADLVLGVAVSPDGQRLAAAGPSPAVRVWDGPHDLLDRQHDQRAALDRTTPLWYRTQAALRIQAKQWPVAIVYLNLLIEVEPDQAIHLLQRGVALAREGRAEEAKKDFDEAKKKKDTLAPAQQAMLHAELGDWDAAARLYAEAAAAKDASPSTWMRHALLRMQQGDRDGYRKAVVTVLGLLARADDPQAANNAAWVCVYAADAVADWLVPLLIAERALLKEASANNLGTLGAVLYRAGRYDLAVQRLTEAVRASGAEGTVIQWLFLAMAEHRLNHADEAARWLAKAKATPDDGRLPWEQRAELQFLRREAEHLLEGK